MADTKQIELLKQGVNSWNNWREKNEPLFPNLERLIFREIDLRHANLYKANLFAADLFKAKLNGADLCKANLSGANLILVDFSTADLSGANLYGADLRGANLFTANLYEADLREANLSGAKLSGANLSGADLSGANLTGADLTGASLIKIQALGTCFRETILTGASVEDWTINRNTNLNSAICDYVYLKTPYQERQPSIGKFAHGEFINLFLKELLKC